jgi:hypothetical protein
MASTNTNPTRPLMSSGPSQPTMTNASLIPPLEPPVVENPYVPAELAEDITARPLTLPDFVDVKLRNPRLSARWIFTDRRRFAQAKAQGWRVARKEDLHPNYEKLNPYEEEGGTKYINGDLILMVIDRQIYLGALKYKHQVAAAIADTTVTRRISAQKAASEMGEDVAAVNRAFASKGAMAPMAVFAPGVEQNAVVPGALGNNQAKEVGRLGGHRDMGTLADLAKQAESK